MRLLHIIALILFIAAASSYINYRFVKLPRSIGLTLITILLSLAIIGIDLVGIDISKHAFNLISSIDFNSTFMGGMISFMLFADALHINTLELAKQKWVISTLTTVGVIISTIIIGLGSWWAAYLMHLNFPLLECLLFGALIAPTDPIAVLSILKKAKAPKSLEIKIAGEALFNDGISIAIFLVLLDIALGRGSMSTNKMILLFLQQLGGGIIFGALLGSFSNWFLKNVNDFEVAILLTLAVVSGGYTIASNLGVSGPITMVIAGLYIGTNLRKGIMSEKVITQLDSFWALINSVLNSVLFVLIGLIVLQLSFSLAAITLALLSIPLVLVARYISVAAPISIFSSFKKYPNHVVNIMTWGGIRGGVSIALALVLPATMAKNEILTATYAVVVFSIIVQGLTIGPLIKHTV